MVYSQICDWLNDFIDGAAPDELLDKWDCEQWIAETEVIEIFTEIVLPTFKKEKTASDALNILKALLWEYYLFRRALSEAAAATAAADKGLYERLLKAPTSQPILNAREFSGILIDGAGRNSILRRSAHAPSINCPDVYAPVIRQIYETITKAKVHADVGTVYHQLLPGLHGLIDGVVDNGCLLGFQGLLSDDDYYYQMQVLMEICNVDVAEVCKYNITSGTTDISGAFSGAFVTVPGKDVEYSPLFTDGGVGLGLWLALAPAGAGAAAGAGAGAAGPIKLWTVSTFEITTMLRNKRWWAAVGLPAYNRFIKDFSQATADPMFLAPVPVNFGERTFSRNSSNSDFTHGPLFIDEDELYK